jgi:glutamate/tyrosine decarboxylase-like PLP-dependent enzyme
MNEPDWKGPLGEAFEEALAYLQGVPARPLTCHTSLPVLRAALGGPLPETSNEPRQVVADLAAVADSGVMASGSGRFFGFVVGGTTPAALAADWLASTWDQNAGLYVLGPAASIVEEVAGEWLAELFGLPAGVSVGFVTGAQMANFTGLSIAFHEVLRRVGWDLAADGLWGAPRIRILAGQARHGTIDRALRFLGAGSADIEEIEADD